MQKQTIRFVTSVCLSFRMEQLGSHWTDIDIWAYFEILSKKIKLLLKSDKSNEYFILRRFDIYDNILLNSSYNEKCFKQICRENQTKNFTFRTFFLKILPFTRKCRKTWWRQRSRRWQYGDTLHAGLVRLHKRKHTPAPAPVHSRPHVNARTSTRLRARARTHTEICNTNCFFTTTTISRTRLNITLHVYCLSCFVSKPYESLWAPVYQVVEYHPRIPVIEIIK